MINFVKAEDCLVEKIVNELMLCHDLTRVSVILPTRRLANYVCLMLADKQKNRASWYPTFYSIEEFVSQHVKAKDSIIDDMSSELVLGGILLDGSWKYLRPGLESELLVFFNAAIESEADVFKEIRRVLDEDVYRSEKGAERLREMTEEIFKCLNEFESALRNAGMVLAVRQLKNAVQEFKNINLDLKNSILAGFTTIRPVLLPALQKLAEGSKLIFNEPFDLISSVSPLLDMISSLGVKVNPKPLEIRSEIDLFECRDITAEIELLINWINELLQVGVKASSIGVLIADEDSYGPLLQTALKRENIKANISLPINVGRTPLGELFKSVANLVPHEASILQISILAMHPLLTSKTPARGMIEKPVKTPPSESSIGSMSPLRADPFSQEINTDNKPEIKTEIKIDNKTELVAGKRQKLDAKINDETKDEGKHKKKVKSQEIASHAEQEFDGRHRVSAYLAGEKDFHVKPKYAVSRDFWESRLAEMSRLFGLHLPAQTLTDWLEFMTDLLDKLEPEELEQEKDKKASMIEARKSILNALAKAARMIFVKFSPGEFWDLVSNKVLLSEIRTVGYPLEGVQILSVKEARHIPFDYVYIPGMLEGTFPAKLPKDTLIEDWLKRKAKIPSWSYVEAMEDTTFGLILQKTPFLSLSWPREVEGKEGVRSRFIERLVALGKTLHEYKGGNFKLFGAADKIHEVQTMQASNELNVSRIKPSNVETLLACPWQYYLISNQVRFWELLESEEDYLSEGNWMHKVVESFLNSKSSALDFAEKQSEQEITAEILKIADEQRQFFEVSQSFYLQMKLKGWPLLANRFKTLFIGWRGGKRETHLGDHAKMEVGDLSIPVSGKIDAVEDFSWGKVIIDFKRSSIPTAAEVAAGIKPQIPIYAAVLGLEQVALAYWSFKKSRPTVVASSIALDSSWISEEDVGKLISPKEAYEKFLEHFQWRLSEPQVYPDVGKVCDRCKFMSSCRKNDPRVSSLLEPLAKWEARLNELSTKAKEPE